LESESGSAGAAKIPSLRDWIAFCQLSVSEGVRAGDPDGEKTIEVIGSPVDEGGVVVEVEILRRSGDAVS
jgi:hypothetical protein